MWLTIEQIRQKFNIDSKAYTTQIESAIGTAARKIKGWVVEEAYADAVAEAVPEDAEKLFRYETVRDAHAFLTMYYLAVSVGNRLSGAGFVKQAQDAASVEGARVVTNQYLTPAEMAANKAGYLAAAKDLVEEFQAATVDDFQQPYSRNVDVEFVF